MRRLLVERGAREPVHVERNVFRRDLRPSFTRPFEAGAVVRLLVGLRLLVVLSPMLWWLGDEVAERPRLPDGIERRSEADAIALAEVHSTPPVSRQQEADDGATTHAEPATDELGAGGGPHAETASEIDELQDGHVTRQ